MSLVPPNFEELSNPLGSHMSHRAKSWSYQYSRVATVRVCQGFSNPCELQVGYMGVRVRVGFSNPCRTCTPGTGWWVTRWLPAELNHGF